MPGSGGTSGTLILGNQLVVGFPERAAEASTPLHPEICFVVACTSYAACSRKPQEHSSSAVT